MKQLLRLFLSVSILLGCSDQYQDSAKNEYQKEASEFAKETEKLLSEVADLRKNKNKPQKKSFVVKQESFLVDCQACKKRISKDTKECGDCGHPTKLSLKFHNENNAVLKEDMTQRHTGWVKSLHPNGKVATLGFYQNGKEEGVHSSWWESGYQLYEINYTQGLKHGLMRTWNDGGSLLLELNYNKGKEHGYHTIYNMDGTTLRQWSYVDGVKIN